MIGVGEETRKSTPFQAFLLRWLIAGGRGRNSLSVYEHSSVRGYSPVVDTPRQRWIDFQSRDTGRVGMTLELGHLFHLRSRCAVVSVGVCMVIDLQLIPFVIHLVPMARIVIDFSSLPAALGAVLGLVMV
jgi:hypothetical protein